MQYIYDTVGSIIEHKKKIEIGMWRTHSRCKSNGFLSLIFHPFIQNKEVDMNMQCNLMRKELFDRFRNVTYMFIRSNYMDQFRYEIPLIPLLELISGTAIESVHSEDYGGSRGWAKKITESSSLHEIQRKYLEKKFDIRHNDAERIIISRVTI